MLWLGGEEKEENGLPRNAKMRQNFQDSGLVLKIAAKGASTERSPLTIVVSKKVARQAVRRNRIRRVLREAAKKELGNLRAAHGLALIVLPEFEASNTAEAKPILRRLFRKAST